eukprot:9875130-Karenia_brevis.AAC.1
MPDAKHRCKLALNAYAPIATKIFGCSAVPEPLRLRFFDSLILSRLLYNVHLWTLGTARADAAVRCLNRVYMQVARMIAGSC